MSRHGAAAKEARGGASPPPGGNGAPSLTLACGSADTCAAPQPAAYGAIIAASAWRSPALTSMSGSHRCRTNVSPSSFQKKRASSRAWLVASLTATTRASRFMTGSSLSPMLHCINP